jgi:2-iminobutanoate/2-iminopropanoate deaminase
MSVKRVLHEGAPSPRGPYSSAVCAGDFIFVSAVGPVDDNDQYSAGGLQEQTRLVIHNLRKILASCGAELSDVVQCSVFLFDAAEFPRMNEVYAEFFGEIKPARTTVEAKFFRHDMLVGMDCVAYKKRS